MATCTATVPNKSVTGDDLYGGRICSQVMISYFWDTYGFAGQKSYWVNGFGWNEPCNTSRPLARTFNACWLLTYSASDYQNDSWNSPILNWARRYVRNNIPRLRARCGDGSAVARSFRGAFVTNRVELYLAFFYNFGVPERAAILLHEARHQGGKSHNANFPTGSVFGAGQSGADSNWGYQGAWMYEALYYWWFYAAGARTTSAMRQRARQEGNVVLDNAFATHPGYSI